ncbi:MAG: hypothetical protein JO318_22060 [Chloroflexi bacterium]|nr:hypothetical protein [Chloroflexota bacterium]MBV9135404.1 hypothetical protein [Chloroflexota bacterium]
MQLETAERPGLDGDGIEQPTSVRFVLIGLRPEPVELGLATTQNIVC